MFITPSMSPGPGECLNQFSDRNAEQRTKKEMETEDHPAGDKFPTRATSQRQGPELIFDRHQERSPLLHKTAHGDSVEVIINSGKFNSEGPGDKSFPYNLKLGCKHLKTVGNPCDTLDVMTRSYRLTGL